jgi:hypothetical protein
MIVKIHLHSSSDVTWVAKGTVCTYSVYMYILHSSNIPTCLTDYTFEAIETTHV